MPEFCFSCLELGWIDVNDLANIPKPSATAAVNFDSSPQQIDRTVAVNKGWASLILGEKHMMTAARPVTNQTREASPLSPLTMRLFCMPGLDRAALTEQAQTDPLTTRPLPPARELRWGLCVACFVTFHAAAEMPLSNPLFKSTPPYSPTQTTRVRCRPFC